MSTQTSIVKNTALAKQCSELLESLLTETPSVIGTVMASVDGHAFAKAFASTHSSEATRVAAIASSVLSLSESFSHETLQGKVSFNCVSTSHGSIMTVRVPSKHNLFVLCAWLDKSDNFATALRFTLDAAGKLAALVNEHP